MSARQVVESRFSPGPIDPRLCLGRDEELRALLSPPTVPGVGACWRIRGGQKIGKTSLLRLIGSPPQKTDPRDRALGDEWRRRPFFWAYIDLDRIRRSVTEPSEIDRLLSAELARPLAPDESVSSYHEVVNLLQLKVDAGAHIVVLCDRVDSLTEVQSDSRATLSQFGEVAHDWLAALNEAVRGMSFAIARGGGSLVRDATVAERREREKDVLRLVSEFFTLIVNDVVLGPVRTEAAAEFLSADVPDLAGMPLNGDDALFVTSLAGGHPFLMNHIALRCQARMTDHGLSAAAKEAITGEAQAFGVTFFDSIIDRLKSTDAKATDFAGEVASSRDGIVLDSTNADLADYLVEEGIARVDDGRCAIQGEVARSLFAGGVGPRRWVVDGPPMPGSVSITGPHPAVVPLSHLEFALLEKLLAARGAYVKHRDLMAVWPPRERDDKKLAQRISVLRNKLREALAVAEDPVPPRKGHGYRLVDPDRFTLNPL